MTNNEHPLTPAPELVQQWVDQLLPQGSMKAFTVAAQWGADHELEACVSWLIENQNPRWAHALRTARRPKPPSLKEQALDELDRIPTHDSEGRSVGVDVSILRRALEALPND